jgi:hypothetical protein
LGLINKQRKQEQAGAPVLAAEGPVRQAACGSLRVHHLCITHHRPRDEPQQSKSRLTRPSAACVAAFGFRLGFGTGYTAHRLRRFRLQAHSQPCSCVSPAARSQLQAPSFLKKAAAPYFGFV